jgi:hypothetical protein
MKKLPSLLIVLAIGLGITAAFAAKRVTLYIYVDPESDGVYVRQPGASYNLKYCQPHPGTYCFYGTNSATVPTRLSQQQVDAYVASGVLSAHYPDRRYEPLLVIE